MAFQTIDRKDITRALRSRAVKEEMDGVLDVAGDVIWFHDPIAATGRWDGKSTFGVKPTTTMIILKTSKAGVKKLISRYKTSYISARKSGGAVDMKDDDKPYITLFIGTQKV